MVGRDGTPVIGIAGWKNSGKTTLTVRLVEELTRRGFRVSTVKHAHHDFQIDESDADSARHRRAGAGQVAVVSPKRWAIIRELGDEPEPALAAVLEMLEPCDVVMVEGYKSAPIIKIEVRRSGSDHRRKLAGSDPNVVAIAADHDVSDACGLPVLGRDDIRGIADLVVRICRLELPALGGKP